MGDRFATRAAVVSQAVLLRLAHPGSRETPVHPKRILIAQNMLLGDAIVLAPLIAKLRANHPGAEIVLTVAPAFVPLFESRPWGVRAVPYSPRNADSARALFAEGPFDLAVVPGDSRMSWLAAAMGARHVVAHAGDLPRARAWFLEDARPVRGTPAPAGELFADLVDGADPPPYGRGDWPAPQATIADAPAGPYAVLHVGASTPLKQWPPDRWKAVADALAARGLAVAWSAGPGEEALVQACDPAGEHRSFAGRLTLAQLWHLLAGASLLVAPDTGVAHLGRVTFTPTLVLFGPGSAPLCGAGNFWRDTPWRALGEPDFPCRDQRKFFRREVHWVRRCTRSPSECPEPRCMHAIAVAAVLSAADEMLAIAGA